MLVPVPSFLSLLTLLWCWLRLANTPESPPVVLSLLSVCNVPSTSLLFVAAVVSRPLPIPSHYRPRLRYATPEECPGHGRADMLGLRHSSDIPEQVLSPLVSRRTMVYKLYGSKVLRLGAYGRSGEKVKIVVIKGEDMDRGCVGY